AGRAPPASAGHRLAFAVGLAAAAGAGGRRPAVGRGWGRIAGHGWVSAVDSALASAGLDQ
ncbi:MAG: hypothetical protein QGG40_12365, partial [Myxococcota bacterium]|nr:hypothetical protein [Myxococcota bacterium]